MNGIAAREIGGCTSLIHARIVAFDKVDMAGATDIHHRQKWMENKSGWANISAVTRSWVHSNMAGINSKTKSATAVMQISVHQK
jgi:hypothetical protein